MSAETPRPPRHVLAYAFDAYGDEWLADTRAALFPNPLALAVVAVRALAAEGYSIVRDGQAVAGGTVCDLDHYTDIDPDDDEALFMVPVYRLRPPSQGIPATKEQQQ